MASAVSLTLSPRYRYCNYLWLLLHRNLYWHCHWHFHRHLDQHWLCHRYCYRILQLWLWL